MWLGQLSCEVSCADWTYADPFPLSFFCADLLIGASSRHDFAPSFAWAEWLGSGVWRGGEVGSVCGGGNLGVKKRLSQQSAAVVNGKRTALV